jgi:hypothetical protein
MWSNHRPFLAFLEFKTDGVDLVFDGPGKHKNSCKQILSQESELCSGRVRLGLINKGQQFFSHNVVMFCIKRPVVLRRFQKSKLSLVNASKTIYSRKIKTLRVIFSGQNPFLWNSCF